MQLLGGWLLNLLDVFCLQENIFEWQFAIRGPRDSEFEGGIYHGRIQLPAEYPFKPPSFMLLTVMFSSHILSDFMLPLRQFHVSFLYLALLWCTLKSVFVMLQPNGRFETQTKICLSISNHHPEHWQPSWSGMFYCHGL